MNVELVISFLKENGRYTPSPEPIHILDIDFHFDGILQGPDDHNGLVLVHGVIGNTFNGVSRQIRAFTLALERTASMRVVTLVLVGQPPDAATFAELSRLCRVLVVPDKSSLGESLASILPLTLPQPLSASDTADVALRTELGDLFADPFVTRLLKAARENEEQVQKTMRAVVDEITQPTKSP